MVKSTAFRLASILIPTLLLIVLGGVIYLVLQDNPASPQTRAVATPDSGQTGTEATLTPAPFLISEHEPVTLDGMLRYAEAELAFGPPQGYALDLAEQAAILTAQERSPATGTILVLRNEEPANYDQEGDDLASIFAAFVRFYAAQDGFALGEDADITIHGLPGRAIDLWGQEAGDFAGRIALAQPDPARLFVMIGVAPTEIWRGQGLADYMAVLETVTFLDVSSSAGVSDETTPDIGAGDDIEADAIAAEPSPTPSVAPPTPIPQPTLVTPTPDLASAEDEDTDAAIIEIPPADTPAPQPTRIALDPARWAVHTNGNFVTRLAVHEDTLWAATTGGAVAWNLDVGSAVKFTTANGLATNHLHGVASCPLPGLGVVFAGDRGLQVYDPASDAWRTLSTQTGELSANEAVDVFCDDQAGYLAVLYARDGVDIYDAATERWARLALDTAALEEEAGLLRRVTGVETGGALWIAAQRGLILLQGDLTAISAANGEEADTAQLDTGLTSNAAQAGSALAPRLEVNVESSVFTPENSPLLSASVTALSPAGGDAIWLASNGAFYRTDGAEWDVFTPETIVGSDFPQGRINGLAVDAENRLWVASDQANICHFDPAEARCVAFFVNASGMVGGPLSSLALDAQGRPYYGALGNGVSRYNAPDSGWEAWVLDSQLSMGNTVRGFALDTEGRLWIGANGGATRLDPGDLAAPVHYTPANSELPFSDVAAIGAGAPGGVWFGANSVAYLHNDIWSIFTPDDNLVDAAIQAIVADGMGRTWLGSQGAGISIWTGSTFFNLTTANGLPSEDITALASVGDVIWIGTRGGGLLRFQNNQLRFFTARAAASGSANNEAGLPSNTITALAVHPQGHLLIGTDRGLAEYVDGEVIPVAGMPAGAITALAVPESSNAAANFWAVLNATTLYRFEGDRNGNLDGYEVFEIESPPIWPPAPISDLQLDPAGRLWVGFQRGGLAIYNP